MSYGIYKLNFLHWILINFQNPLIIKIYANGIANNKLATTLRTDKWWIEPLWTGLGFLGFVVYTTWAVFQADHYWWSAGQEGFGGYLSPFYL